MRLDEAATSFNSAGALLNSSQRRASFVKLCWGAGLLLRKAGYVGYNEFASLKALLGQSFRLAKSDFDREFAGGAMEGWLGEAGSCRRVV